MSNAKPPILPAEERKRRLSVAESKAREFLYALEAARQKPGDASDRNVRAASLDLTRAIGAWRGMR